MGWQGIFDERTEKRMLSNPERRAQTLVRLYSDVHPLLSFAAGLGNERGLEIRQDLDADPLTDNDTLTTLSYTSRNH